MIPPFLPLLLFLAPYFLVSFTLLGFFLLWMLYYSLGCLRLSFNATLYVLSGKLPLVLIAENSKIVRMIKITLLASELHSHRPLLCSVTRLFLSCTSDSEATNSVSPLLTPALPLALLQHSSPCVTVPSSSAQRFESFKTLFSVQVVFSCSLHPDSSSLHMSAACPFLLCILKA